MAIFGFGRGKEHRMARGASDPGRAIGPGDESRRFVAIPTGEESGLTKARGRIYEVDTLGRKLEREQPHGGGATVGQ